MYVVVNILSFFSARDSVLNLFKKDDSMSDSIFNSALLVMLVSCSSFPVFSLIDSPKFVQYLHKWEQFQVGNNSISCNSVSTENYYVLTCLISAV